MNPFIMGLKELILLSRYVSETGDGKPNVSEDEFVKHLNRFNETFGNNCGSEELINLKLDFLGSLTSSLRGLHKNDHKISVVNAITNVLRTCTIDNPEFFIHLYNSLFYQIYQEKNVRLSEELKLAVLEFGIELIKRTTMRVFPLLYDVNNGPKFSMGVLIAVQIAKEEKSIKLRTTALDFLLYAMQYHRRNDKVLQRSVGDLFMLYLPGIIGRIQDIIIRDETQPHLITVKALTCWGQLLCTVMQDLEEEEVSDQEKIRMWMKRSSESTNDNFDMKEALQEKKRTKRWLRAASQTLRPLILKIPEARKHSHGRVRLELAAQISCILESCSATLMDSLDALLGALISSSEDEDSEVREVADLAVSRFESRCRSGTGSAFANVVEDNLNGLISRLPNVLHLRDDAAIFNAVQCLCGDLKILRSVDRLGQLINFSPTLTRLVRVLLIASRLEMYPEISAREYSVWDDEPSSQVWKKEWKRFKHFMDDRIRNKLIEICRLLGESGEAETVLDFLFDTFNGDPSCRNEVLFLANEIVSGASVIQDNVIRQFLELYLHPDNLYLTLEVDDDMCTTVQQSHANIVTVALLMEGVGKLAAVIGKRFEDYLKSSLYYIIEKMGSSYRVIRRTAMEAAVEISKATGLEGDVSLLIQENVDYLTYHITIKLRRSHPGVFDVVTVLMRNSPFEAVTNLEEIVQNVLKSSSEKFDSPHTLSYLRLFHTFIQCVCRWLQEGVDSKPDDESSKPREEKNEVDLLLEYIREKEKPKEESDDEMEEEAHAAESVQENDQEERDEEWEAYQSKKEKLPKHIKLTIGIAETALNYLPSLDFDKKLVALDILNGSISILADRENELLPLVHKIWSPLVTRFDRVTDPLLINRSFALLYNMSRTSKDFIRRRTLKNVLPTLRNFLSKSAEKSKLKDSGSGYHFTQSFKLQKELLSKLACIAVDLRLSGKELDAVAECSLPYVSSLQPLPLQENCRKFFVDLSEHDPFIVWYKLHPLLAQGPEYEKNVQLVLDGISEAAVTTSSVK